MTRTSLLRKTADWEAARPDWAIYDHFFYNEAGQVRKVEGLIDKIYFVNEDSGTVGKIKGYTEVRWDGSGCCWSANGNVRKKQYDIHFK